MFIDFTSHVPWFVSILKVLFHNSSHFCWHQKSSSMMAYVQMCMDWLKSYNTIFSSDEHDISIWFFPAILMWTYMNYRGDSMVLDSCWLKTHGFSQFFPVQTIPKPLRSCSVCGTVAPPSPRRMSRRRWSRTALFGEAMGYAWLRGYPKVDGCWWSTYHGLKNSWVTECYWLTG